MKHKLWRIKNLDGNLTCPIVAFSDLEAGLTQL